MNRPPGREYEAGAQEACVALLVLYLISPEIFGPWNCA
jgi:hypothetical protein